MLNNLVRKVFIYHYVENEGIACGMAVLEKGDLGITLSPLERTIKQRVWKAITYSIRKHGKNLGAHKAYLQVMVNNEPAKSLYKKIGF